MHQSNHFFNLGYGWLCKHCSAEDAERKNQHQDKPEPARMVLALATWTDSSHDALTCPRCGIEEMIKAW
jgi:hypothetical protein